MRMFAFTILLSTHNTVMSRADSLSPQKRGMRLIRATVQDHCEFVGSITCYGFHELFKRWTQDRHSLSTSLTYTLRRLDLYEFSFSGRAVCRFRECDRVSTVSPRSTTWSLTQDVGHKVCSRV